MKIHVLPGDAQAGIFPETGLDGEIVVCRECLADGPVEAVDLDDFWAVRANFVAAAYGGGEAEYDGKVAGEFRRLEDLPAGSEVDLWFEDELFCHANMWFTLSLLRESKAEIFRVAPGARAAGENPRSFGGMNGAQLRECYQHKTRLTGAGVALGAALWRAFQSGDAGELERLSAAGSEAFPDLAEIGRAALERESRPRRVLKEITAAGAADFKEVFPEFSRRAAVYGYGDAQVKRIILADDDLREKITF